MPLIGQDVRGTDTMITGADQQAMPRRGIDADHACDPFAGEATGVQAAFRAGPLQHPGPVLGVRLYGHSRNGTDHTVMARWVSP
jgi:hypothetical protein